MARREWGSGSIFKLKNGRWRVSVSLGSDAFGKRVRKEWQVRSEAAAKAKLRDAQRRLSGGLPVEESRVTLGVYAQEWLSGVRHNVRPSTAAFYRTLAEVHLDDLAHLPLAKITPSEIRSLMAARLADNYSPRTVRGIVDVLRMILKQALVDGIVTRNVAELVQRPKLEQAEPKHFTADEARRFLDGTRADPLYGLYAVALGTGLRRGELLSLTWADIDADYRSLRVRRSKTGAGVRSVPLPGFARAALMDTERRPGVVWQVRPEYVTRRFAELCRRAGVPVLTLHQLRHTASTLMMEAGVPIDVRRRILGHSRTEQTLHYSHADDAQRRDAVERLGRMIG